MKLQNLYPCVIGLGYVGFPIFTKLDKKFKTVGYDINLKRINNLKKGINLNQINQNKFRVKNKSLFTNKLKDIKYCNFYIITVPTPIYDNQKPNLEFLIKATKTVGKVLKKGDIVFYESTVYPGVTLEVCLPILKKISKLNYKTDFNIGYSPERINPGDKKNTLRNITKLISFENLKIKKKALSIYKSISKKIFISNSIIETETSKVIENIQRDLNIALMNEIFIVCKRLNIDFKNVIKLASTKWNFLKFNPGLVGGHCLPVDPYYFAFLAKKNKIKTNIILSGRHVNNFMKNFFISEIKKKINKKEKLLIFGVSYKENVPDLRNSLSLKVYIELKKNFNVSAFDSSIKNEADIKKYKLKAKIGNLKKYDKFLFLVNHDCQKKYLNLINRKYKEKLIKIIN